MVKEPDRSSGPSVRWFAIGLAGLSATAFVLTAWILHDLQHEQAALAELIRDVPKGDMTAAVELANDLRLQHRLLLLLVLNILGTAIAFAFVVRAYFSSERSLRDAKVLATDVRASIDAALITTDRSGQLTSVNPQGYALINLKPDCLGMPLSEVDSQHAALSAMCSEVLAKHVNIRNRDYSVMHQGHRRTLRAGCVLLRNQRQEEIGTVVHVTDITENALIEERLRRMERYMGLGSLAVGLQHEIRNPLSALSLHIQLLREKLEGSTAGQGEVAELLDVLQQETARINAVLDGFGNYASMRPTNRSPVDLPALIERLARLLRPQASQHNVEIELSLPKTQVRMVHGDTVRLEQMLLNLALNGLAAMPEGGRLSIRLAENDEGVQIEVADTGQGVPATVQSRIFDPYFTTRPHGTGMGLPVSEKIVRQHGGNIDFTSNTSGTVFSISLPWEAAEWTAS
ncbi:MAG: PAS domain-containing protein [Planctomycetales bacterium]|nr:PAS domain-containing protein [Planctomycetales bacterium]